MRKHFIAYLITAGLAAGIVTAASEAAAAKGLYWCAAKNGVISSYMAGVYDDPSRPPRFASGNTYLGSVTADNQAQADKRCQVFASLLTYAGGGGSTSSK